MRIGALTLWSFALCVTFGFNSVSSHAQGVNVTTWHNDVGRTGQNTNETALTTTLVENYNQFGKLCTASLDGRAYAQPLVVANVKFQGQTVAKPIAYVATMNDSVYAIDGTSCQVLGQFALFPTGSGEFAAKTVDLGQGVTSSGRR